MMDISFLKEFRLEWRLGGKADSTANDYGSLLELLFDIHAQPTLCVAMICEVNRFCVR